MFTLSATSIYPQVSRVSILGQLTRPSLPSIGDGLVPRLTVQHTMGDEVTQWMGI